MKYKEKRNIEALSCIYCCSDKTLSVTYSEYVFVDLGIEYSMRMCHNCCLWPVRLYNIFPHYFKSGRIL